MQLVKRDVGQLCQISGQHLEMLITPSTEGSKYAIRSAEPGMLSWLELLEQPALPVSKGSRCSDQYEINSASLSPEESMLPAATGAGNALS